MAGYTKAKTGSMNSSADTGGKKMGNTPGSDKAGKMIDREPVKGGLSIKKGPPDRERTDQGRSSKKMPDRPPKDGFDKLSRGR